MSDDREPRANNIGKALLRGHALADEGKAHYNAEGFFRWRGGYAKCECGALFGPFGGAVTQAAAKRWHRAHKDSLR